MPAAFFVIPALVALVALIVTLRFSPALWREGSRTLVAALLSLAAMVPQASLCLEYGVRLLTHTSVLLLEAHSTSGLASLWLLVGPLLFSFSFRCSRRATSRVLHIVRTGHVVGWAFSAPPTLFTMIQI